MKKSKQSKGIENGVECEGHFSYGEREAFFSLTFLINF